jgi:hypothetical protein
MAGGAQRRRRSTPAPVQPRWRLARVVEVLSDRRGGRASPSVDRTLQDRFDRLDALDAKVRAAKTLGGAATASPR